MLLGPWVRVEVSGEATQDPYDSLMHLGSETILW